MKNIPRLFIDKELHTGSTIELAKDQIHYLVHVMRTGKFIAFNNGLEFDAEIIDNSKCKILNKTNHFDPSGDFTLYFAPIKKIEDLLSGATQMGVKVLQPVITERTVARHGNFSRMQKILIEASEQSGRNSIPELKKPIKFNELDKSGIVYGDERKLSDTNTQSPKSSKLFIGPEGGFSDKEFAELDAAGAIGISLGKTILRAEIAALALIAIAKK
jgi:16S rRNA (uracil1498-N3)-methyltransferase